MLWRYLRIELKKALIGWSFWGIKEKKGLQRMVKHANINSEILNN